MVKSPIFSPGLVSNTHLTRQSNSSAVARVPPELHHRPASLPLKEPGAHLDRILLNETTRARSILVSQEHGMRLWLQRFLLSPLKGQFIHDSFRGEDANNDIMPLCSGVREWRMRIC